ncbi:DUF2147 domain-containing protein [Alterisphingorhabdus coralli]|uniref:DUF2147 domain-containing protein n=1 Tax=Alterisphingorhabdus coralli TaxID=3071408 RepID=A0AA97I2B5_9SPHN|nr:DUF2147 domain-containing protein [Parasphingorhabdus sp. SCSIO 66989]WOE76053.1 DUF2147 domain-containing protein [Parasphingorhabdus sp. SCSIO 66989]
MMKMIRFLLALTLASAVLAPALARPASINGRWLTEEKDSIITISQCGSTVCGKIERILVQTPDANQKDVNNPNPKLRSRPVLGLPVLLNFRPDDTKWNGKAYDPKTGRTYTTNITLLKNGKLKVQGCVAIFCQSQYWTRAS